MAAENRILLLKVSELTAVSIFPYSLCNLFPPHEISIRKRIAFYLTSTKVITLLLGNFAVNSIRRKALIFSFILTLLHCRLTFLL